MTAANDSKLPIEMSDAEWRQENKHFMDRTCFKNLLLTFFFFLLPVCVCVCVCVCAGVCTCESMAKKNCVLFLELRVSALWDNVYHGPDAETVTERAALVLLIDAAMKHGVQFSYAYLSEYPELADLD
jgi:hypothetical protein